MKNATDSPPIILDIEASGFGPHSYPIEIGIAINGSHSYCSLIKPEAHWNYWDKNAEAIHCISRSQLQSYGKDIRTVASDLNQLLSGKTTYSDGWVVDKPWLTLLFHTAQTPLSFWLSPIELILTEQQIEFWDSTKIMVTNRVNLDRHRASADARIIQETYLQVSSLHKVS